MRRRFKPHWASTGSWSAFSPRRRRSSPGSPIRWPAPPIPGSSRSWPCASAPTCRPSRRPTRWRDAIDAIAPALELVDLDRPLDDLHAILAGNVFHRGALLGDFDAARAGGELDGLAVAVHRSGEEAGSVSAAESYGDLLEIVRVVSRRLALVGESLRAGQFVIAGSLTPIVPVAAGDEVRADFGPLGMLAIEFTD